MRSRSRRTGASESAHSRRASTSIVATPTARSRADRARRVAASHKSTHGTSAPSARSGASRRRGLVSSHSTRRSDASRSMPTTGRSLNLPTSTAGDGETFATYDTEANEAAVAIQSAARGRLGRRRVEEMREGNDSGTSVPNTSRSSVVSGWDMAGTLASATRRSRVSRRSSRRHSSDGVKLPSRPGSAQVWSREEDEAAIKIQSIARARRDRRRIDRIRQRRALGKPIESSRSSVGSATSGSKHANQKARALRGVAIAFQAADYVGDLVSKRDQRVDDLIAFVADKLRQKYGTRESLRQIYREWDDDGDGRCSLPEFTVVLEAAGIAFDAADTKAVFDRFDTKSRGVLDFEEVTHEVFEKYYDPLAQQGGRRWKSLQQKKAHEKVMEKRRQDPEVKRLVAKLAEVMTRKWGENGAQLRRAMRQWDENSDGGVSRKEFGEILDIYGLGLSQLEIAKLHARFDVYDLGKLDFNEFSSSIFKATSDPLGSGNTAPDRQRDLERLIQKAKEVGLKTKKQAPRYTADQVIAMLRRRYGASSSLQSVFRAWDADKSGSLSIEELSTALRAIGIPTTDEEIAKIASKVDDGDQDISYEEFVDLVYGNEEKQAELTYKDRKKRVMDEEEEAEYVDFWNRVDHLSSKLGPVVEEGRVNQLNLRFIDKLLKTGKSVQKLFRTFDLDKDGTVSYSELRHVLRNLKLGFSKEDIDLVIAHADRSRDGDIDYVEFAEKVRVAEVALQDQMPQREARSSEYGTDSDDDSEFGAETPRGNDDGSEKRPGDVMWQHKHGAPEFSTVGNGDFAWAGMVFGGRSTVPTTAGLKVAALLHADTPIETLTWKGGMRLRGDKVTGGADSSPQRRVGARMRATRERNELLHNQRRNVRPQSAGPHMSRTASGTSLGRTTTLEKVTMTLRSTGRLGEASGTVHSEDRRIKSMGRSVPVGAYDTYRISEAAAGGKYKGAGDGRRKWAGGKLTRSASTKHSRLHDSDRSSWLSIPSTTVRRGTGNTDAWTQGHTRMSHTPFHDTRYLISPAPSAPKMAMTTTRVDRFRTTSAAIGSGKPEPFQAKEKATKLKHAEERLARTRLNADRVDRSNVYRRELDQHLHDRRVRTLVGHRVSYLTNLEARNGNAIKNMEEMGI